MATEPAGDGGPRRRFRAARAPAAVLAVAIVAGLAVWLATGPDEGAPPGAGPGRSSIPADVVVREPEDYLGERIEVRGRVAAVAEDGFVLGADGESLLVLAPTGGPFPRVAVGEVVAAGGSYRPLEPEEARRLGLQLAAVGDGRALVALWVDSLGPPARR